MFGQTMKKSTNKGGNGSRYQRQFGNSSNNKSHSVIESTSTSATLADTKATEAAARRRARQDQGEAIDIKFGYQRLEDQYQHSNQQSLEKIQRRGWIFHMLATTVRIAM
jgi:hypothetical protein